MNITKYKLICLAAVFAAAAGCSREQVDKGAPTGSVPVAPSGVMTRSDGVNGANIYMSAFTGSLSTGFINYFSDRTISFPGGLSTDEARDVAFAGTRPYYPLGGLDIYIFGHSGKLVENSKMKLVAGHTAVYDAVLSNYGKTEGRPADDPAEWRIGTQGNANIKAELMYFRHVMSRLTVKIEVDPTETPAVTPPPSRVQFQLPGVKSQGEITIRTKWITTENPTAEEIEAADGAIASGKAFTIQLGDNYLIPDKTNLTGLKFSSLKIDDYTATAADLQNFTIQADNGSTPDQPMYLLPGFAYELTLTVRKLKIEGARLTKVDWTPKVLNPDDPDYVEQKLTLNTGTRYVNTGDDAITRVVLHTADRMYVGESDGSAAGYSYITLPADGVTGVDLYTAHGLLLSAPAGAFTYNGGTLTMDISAGGMTTQSGAAASSSNPYMVETAVQFINMAKDFSAQTGHYKLAADINLDDLYVHDFNGFSGTFNGTIDGNGHHISHLDIVGAGLFETNAGTIQNLRIYTGTIDARELVQAGSICMQNDGRIAGCINQADVIGATVTVAGGICGVNGSTGTIAGCLNTGNIFGQELGGICSGNANDAPNAITACLNTGMLKLDFRPRLVGAVAAKTVDAPGVGVINTCFWLTGTAQKYVGTEGSAVDQGDILSIDTSAQSPKDLRATDRIDPDKATVLERLNSALAADALWGQRYEFAIDYTASGLTWPYPRMK